MHSVKARGGGPGRQALATRQPLTAPYLPILPDHDVVTVPIANAQHVCGHTVAGAGKGELLNGSIQGLPGWGESGRWGTMALDTL